MGLKRFELQLVDARTGKTIADSGGKAFVATVDTSKKATLYTAAGASQTNPIALSQGKLAFYVDQSVNSVDLYIQAPSGHFVVLTDVVPQMQDIRVDLAMSRTTMVIPVSVNDCTTNTETDTGFDLVTNSFVDSIGMGIHVLTNDASQSIEVGLLSSESGGDADGFIDAVSVAVTNGVTAVAAPTWNVGSNETFVSATTVGALSATFKAGSDVAGRYGVHDRKPHRCDGTAKSISYTMSVNADTLQGFVILPVMLNGGAPT